MDEVAEFVDGHMDGRTLTVRDPAPDIIQVPVPIDFPLTALVNEDDDPALGIAKPSFVVEDYKRIGRNDAGRLRYSKLSR